LGDNVMNAFDPAVAYHPAEDFPELRGQLVAVYEDVYAQEARADPFFSVERFTERLSTHANEPRWGCAIAHVGREPVGYAYGFARTARYRWQGLLTPSPPDDLVESDTRTFALCEVMVRSPWRGTGIARALHDHLMSHRTEERSHLLVEDGHPRVRALYEQWDYQWMGVMQPFPDSPRYDSLVRPLR